jgi:thioredoxin 1
MSVITVTEQNFNEVVMQSDKPVLIDLWASWCGPCMMLSPIVDEVSDERTDIKVCKINVDEQPNLAMQFKVISIPMLVVVKDGKVAGKSIGLVDKAEIIKLIEG